MKLFLFHIFVLGTACRFFEEDLGRVRQHKLSNHPNKEGLNISNEKQSGVGVERELALGRMPFFNRRSHRRLDDEVDEDINGDYYQEDEEPVDPDAEESFDDERGEDSSSVSETQGGANYENYETSIADSQIELTSEIEEHRGTEFKYLGVKHVFSEYS